MQAIARIRWATALAAALAAAGLTACGGDDEAGGASAAGSAGSNAPEIAFDRDGDIWVMNADGSDQTKLTDAPRRGGDTQPAWSPDGERIAFSRWEDGESAIWVINADGSDATRLTTGGPTPRWRPDGTRIAGRSEGSPAFSPDGKRIAFGRSESTEGREVAAVYAMSADGSDVTQLTDGPADGAPAWSPDGQRIVFSRDRPPSEAGIYVMNAYGSGQTRLTGGPELEGFLLSSPTFSPNGEQVAFLGSRIEEGEPPGLLWMLNADGGEPTQLLARSSVPFRRPAFSPDGQRILFVAEATAKRPSGLIVVNADGSDPLPVPDTRDFRGFVSWSPAG